MLDEPGMRLPTVEFDLMRDSEVIVAGRGVVFEQLACSSSTDDDADMSMAGRQHCGSASVEMERGRVLASGERMPDDHDVELTPLKTVRGVDHNFR